MNTSDSRFPQDDLNIRTKELSFEFVHLLLLQVDVDQILRQLLLETTIHQHITFGAYEKRYLRTPIVCLIDNQLLKY